ncbi:hypothetical protein [Pseudomonas serbica]|uniref:hypothetical protein n=1 Tax=Pseudomonas serbica TaxID=2965074 RepID=UPI00237AE5BF|nr:hypothetical protein [Pseudomonas serbica]
MTVLVGLNLGTHVVVISDTRSMSVNPMPGQKIFKNNRRKRHLSVNSATVYGGIERISKDVAGLIRYQSVKSYKCFEVVIDFLKGLPSTTETDIGYFERLAAISGLHKDGAVELIYHNLYRFIDDGFVRKSGIVEIGNACISYPGTITKKESHILDGRINEVLCSFFINSGNKFKPSNRSALGKLIIQVTGVLTELAKVKSEISSKFNVCVKDSEGNMIGGTVNLSKKTKIKWHSLSGNQFS